MMKTRLLVSAVAVALALAACGGGGSSSSTGGGTTGGGGTIGGGTVVTEKASDVLKTGLFITSGNVIEQITGTLSNGEWTLNQANMNWDGNAYQNAPAASASELVFDSVSKTWVAEVEPSTATDNADGSITRGVFKLGLQSIDVSGKRLVDYVPFGGYGQSNLSITDGAKFSNGAKWLQITKTLTADRYELIANNLGGTISSTSELIATLQNAETWLSSGGDKWYGVKIATVNADKTAGTVTISSWVSGKPYTTSGTWKKVALSPTVDILELTGLPVETSEPHRKAGLPFITVYQNRAWVGFHLTPQTLTDYEDRYTAYFNKIAIDDIKTNTRPAADIGGIAGYGTALNAKTALQNGVNYLLRRNSGALEYTHYGLKTNPDGTLEQDAGDGWVYTFNGKTFDKATAAKPRNGIYLDATKKDWSLLTGNNSLTVQPDGTALLGNTWNGGQIKASFSAVDLNGKYLADFDPTDLLSSYFKPYAKFSSGAQWLSQRYVQQTAGYILWSSSGIGYSSLDALLAGNGISAWIGQDAKVKFIAGAAGATTGTLQVTDNSGNALGNGTWARKTVNGVEMIEITSLPAGAAKYDFANNIHRIYSVYNGAVCEGMAVLPGKVDTTNFPIMFNDQAIKDIVAAVW